MAVFTWGPIIGTWPKPLVRNPERAQWYTNKAKALALIERELHQLEVFSATILADVAVADVKKDGSGLYRDARLRSERVILRFRLPEVGDVEYPSGNYVDLPQNLHAIGLTLQRLRLIDQYGATISGARQQYRGFKRLGTGTSGDTSAPEPPMQPMDAAGALAALAFPDVDTGMVAAYGEMIFRDAEFFRMADRKAARNSHPDSGGNSDSFHRYTRAKSVLQTLHLASAGAP